MISDWKGCIGGCIVWGWNGCEKLEVKHNETI